MNNIKHEKTEDLQIETDKRIERMDAEMKAQKDFVLTTFENTEGYNQMVIMKNISAVAKCEHHHCEFQCIVHAGYLPTKQLMGASKFNRITRKHLNLGEKTLQERATQQILEDLMELKPLGAMVVIEGKHSCIMHRGVRDNSTMITSGVGGVFKDDALARQEFLSLIK